MSLACVGQSRSSVVGQKRISLQNLVGQWIPQTAWRVASALGATSAPLTTRRTSAPADEKHQQQVERGGMFEFLSSVTLLSGNSSVNPEKEIYPEMMHRTRDTVLPTQI